MSDTVIKAEGVSKQYRLGLIGGGTLRADFQRLWARLRGQPDPLMRVDQAQPTPGGSSDSLWALSDVSFDVKRGEILGIIGRNGAGKSTILKILSRVTAPTLGEIKVKGRIASLLEVGTGFHPELTGRENIFLNGAILGMSKAEIKRKFDEISAFAEVEKFIDTPVKRYSSGMYVRLAFAVAAHLEPEILIVDEVLAVGDAEFQKKCLGKMKAVSSQGRTVLFVSHNMNAVQELCTRAMLLKSGRIAMCSTDVDRVTQDYLFGDKLGKAESEWRNPGMQFVNPYFMPMRFAVTDAQGRLFEGPVANDELVWISAEGRVEKQDPSLTIGCAIYAENGDLVFMSYQTDTGEDHQARLPVGQSTLRCALPKRLLNEGRYRVEFIGGLHHREWLYEPQVNAPSITLIVQGGLSDSPFWMAKRPGVIAPVLPWEVIQ